MRDQPGRETTRRACDIRIRMPPHAIAIVIDEEFSAALFQHPENVDERRHARIFYVDCVDNSM